MTVNLNKLIEPIMTNNKLVSSVFYVLFTLLISIAYVHAEAIADIKKQAEQENASAQNKLGKHYYNDNNKSLAETWFRKAANHGYADGQFNLGMIFHENKRYKEAEKWFRKAAEKGHIKAQINMGSYYYVGRGVDKNIRESSHWFSKASQQGSIEGFQALEHIFLETSQHKRKSASSVDYKQLVGNVAKAALLINEINKLIPQQTKLVKTGKTSKECETKVANRIASCWASLDGCDASGDCNYKRHCDKNNGLFNGNCSSGFLPYETDYYCDPVTNTHNIDKQYLVSEVCS